MISCGATGLINRPRAGATPIEQIGIAASGRNVPECDPGSANQSWDHARMFTCEIARCSKKFRRHYELKRHEQQCHSHGERYSCTAQGCYSKGSQRHSFTRSDKLTSHIRTCHHSKTVFRCVLCPTTMPLEELGLHCRRKHRNDRSVAAILNATSWKRCRCPVFGCRKYILLTSFQSHLATHSQGDVQGAEQSLRDMGYMVMNTNEANFGNERASITFGILCPVCGTSCDSCDVFKHHFWSAHLFQDAGTGLDHFVSWRAKLSAICFWDWRKSIAASPPWDIPGTATGKGVCRIRCDHCSFAIVRDSQNNFHQEHPSFMRSVEQIVEELFPFRMHILRLYPEFESHPIFDDYKTAPAAQDNGSNEST